MSLSTLCDHTNDVVLLFEGETLKAVPPLDIWCDSVLDHPDGQMILVSRLATMEDNVCNSISKYELTYNNSIIYREIEDLLELTEILKSCGFRVPAIKTFDYLAAYDENDETIVYECKK